MAALRLWKGQQFVLRGMQTYYMAPISLRCCSSKGDSNVTTSEVRGPPKLAEAEWQLEFQQPKGVVGGKMPHKMMLTKGKTYKWCVCGHSKRQPMCDGTHQISQLRIKLRPIVFKAPEDCEVWLCNCKQTNNRPYCDGSHRSQEVQNPEVLY